MNNKHREIILGVIFIVKSPDTEYTVSGVVYEK